MVAVPIPMGATPVIDSTMATREENFPDFPDFPDLLVFAAFPVLGAFEAFDVDSYGITEVGGM